jgi:hypothetical protein
MLITSTLHIFFQARLEPTQVEPLILKIVLKPQTQIRDKGGSDKLSSLRQYGIFYDRKKF